VDNPPAFSVPDFGAGGLFRGFSPERVLVQSVYFRCKACKAGIASTGNRVTITGIAVDRLAGVEIEAKLG
jgi:hypothetical protein